MNGRTDDKAWGYRTLWLIAILAVARIVYTWWVPIDLVHDEAYYWDWSRQLDWGYYSKPPLVAWLIAGSTFLFGSSPLAVRLPAILLGTGGLVWAYLLAARLYGRRAGFWAVCLSAATPGNAALSLLMTIDAPLLFCWSASLYSFWRLFEPGPRRRLWFLAAVLSAGLGMLSKQTMCGFLVLGGFFLLTSREDRAELVRPTFWLWLVGSLAFLTPVLWWNSQHGWITAQHTSEHFHGEVVGLVERFSRCAEFVGGQFGVLSPLTCFLLLVVMVAGLRAYPRLDRSARFLLCFSAVPLTGVYALSLWQQVEPNWPAAFYPSAFALLVGLALGKVALPVWPRIVEKSLLRAAVVGMVAAAAAYLIPFGLGLEGTRLDAVVRLRGWQRLADCVARRRADLPRAERTFLIVAAGRTVASELAFYLPDQPRVYVWTPGRAILSQYDVWGGPQNKTGWDALIVTDPGWPTPPELRQAFARVEDAGRVDVPIGHGRHHTFQLWRGADFTAWPARQNVAADPANTPTRR